jgi:Mrp family chromosome partitioning ATPase
MTSVQTYAGGDDQKSTSDQLRPWSVEEWLDEGRKNQRPASEAPEAEPSPETALANAPTNQHEWMFSACEQQVAELVLRIDVRLSGRTPRLIQFIGVDRGVGSSTVALAYATASAALRRRRVLFLSSDEGQSGPGVLECVAQGMPLDGAITKLHGTLFCGALTGAGNSGIAARTLMADAALIQAVRASCDEVVLDCRCTEASQAALTVAPHADGVVLVMQAARTRQSSVQELVDALNALKAEVLGVVLNRSTPSRRSTPGNPDN